MKWLKESVHYQNNKHVCRQRFKPSNVNSTLNEEDGIEVYCFFVLIFPLNLRSLLLIIQWLKNPWIEFSAATF